MGAQGLMQVMTQIHSDKYESFGGKLAAFDPVTNLRVGVKVLQECIARAGSVEGGLKLYVGAGNLEADGGYAGKVMGEHARLAPGRPGPRHAHDAAGPPSDHPGGRSPPSQRRVEEKVASPTVCRPREPRAGALGYTHPVRNWR